jgi:RNA polymerase sigma-70 factor (ECF subfamily)
VSALPAALNAMPTAAAVGMIRRPCRPTIVSRRGTDTGAGVNITVDADFDAATAAFRHELVVHCYRMLGSVDEAEDLAQETLLRAWRARSRYDAERASLRTWLYRIATNACLTALEGRPRRPLPTGLGAASDDPDTPLVPDFAVPWLQPLPDSYLRREHADPLERAVERDGVRLALVAAMQYLPPRQRAVLVLRDVLRFSAAEVAGQLDTSTAAVNSALARARAAIAAAAPQQSALPEPGERAVRDTIERYIRAFESADVPALVTLLTDDAVLEMPPVPLWYARRRRRPAPAHPAGADREQRGHRAQCGVPGPAGVRGVPARQGP